MANEDEAPISHLQRRKIESGVLIPFVEACERRFGAEATRELVVETIRELAKADGAKWAAAYGTGLDALARIAEEVWAGGGSLEIEFLERSEDRLSFNVTRCRYAEFYKELGRAGLGHLVHCNRDFAMIEGFDPGIELTRHTTIMDGATCCDFRFRRKRKAQG